MPTPENAQGMVITRIFDAPRELVWKAWTDPELVKKWWGPKIFKAPHVSIDFRVGGKYLFCMQAEEGEEVWKKGIWSTGEYKEIIPMEKIVCTDSFADENGNAVSSSHYGMEGMPMELLITVTFEDTKDGKTKMILRHEGMPEAFAKDASAGWDESFDKLAEAIKL